MGEKVYEVRKVKDAGKGMPLIGDEFPKMEVQTTHGMMKLPKDMKGKWFILFSHPGDFTPVCTTEFMAFQQRIDQFQELNCELIGFSVDQVHSHIKWTDWIRDELGVEITFPIIADTGKVANNIGNHPPLQGFQHRPGSIHRGSPGYYAGHAVLPPGAGT